MTLGAALNPRIPGSRREYILQVAEEVFAESGYDRARLEDVAQRVGIRRASLLYHFRDKAALYAAVLDAIFAELSERYRRVLGGRGPAGVRLEQMIDVWLDFIAVRPAILAIMLREVADRDSVESRRFADRAITVFGPFLDVIAEGQRRRELRRTEAMPVLMALGGASAFLVLGHRIAPSGMAEAAIVERARQRDLLFAVVQKLLGTRGPRPVLDD